MKFARYLEENVVVEWRKAYINYRGLKKLIKKVDKRYKARVSLELSKQHSIQSSTNSSLKQFSAAALDGLRKRQRRLSTTSGGEASDDPIWLPTTNDSQNQQKLNKSNLNQSTTNGNRIPRVEFEDDDRSDRFPKVSLDGTGLSIDSELSQTDTHPYYPDNRTGTNNDERTNVDVELGEQATSSKNDNRRRTLSNGKSDNSLFDRLKRNNEGAGIGFSAAEDNLTPKKRAKRARKKERGEAELSEIINSTFDEQERLFFKALDSELARIVKFYTLREEDMSKRYTMIARQLEELADHRREYKATHQTNNLEAWTDLSHRFSHLVAPISQPAQTLKRASMQIRRNESPSRASGAGKPSEGTPTNENSTASTATKNDPNSTLTTVDEGDKRRVLALSKMLNVYGGTLSETEDEELRKANRLAAYSHDPERYKAARKKLKTAVLEYYRGLEILKNYKILNRTGFAKILKKFEKTTQVHCADSYYHSKVSSSVLVSSEIVEKLLKGTEEIYTAYFEHGNRKRALERLRIHTGSTSEQNSSTHHLSTTRTGFYLGITLCATIAGLVCAMHPETRKEIPLWDQLMRVYGAEFLPTLFVLLFGINLSVWHHSRVNAVFIFEWDVRHVLDFHQFFELPAFFLLLLSIAFWVSFLNPFPDKIAPTTWPLVWLVVVLVIMLNPLPIGYYHARKWLIISLGRVFHGGILSRVEFRDFFLGDELNSLNWSISMLWFIGCQYNHNWAYPNQCDPNSTFWTAVLLAIPAFLRFVQCFRRWYDSNYTADLHLVNAGKYASSMFHYFLYINYRYHGSKPGKELAVWCVFASIYSIYTSSWDIIMDWSLLQPKARYPFLRNELVYEQYWPFYYFAILTDIVLRFSWTFYLAPGPAGSLTRIFIIALLEMLRRWQWNFLRLENEHLGNVDMYRVSREVPLPYHVQRTDATTDDEEEGDIRMKKKRFGDIPAIASKKMKHFIHLDRDQGKNKIHEEDEEWRVGNDENQSSFSSSSQQQRGGFSKTDKGKQATSDTSEEEIHEGNGWSNEDTLVPSKGRQGSSSLATRIRDSLVPDKGGIESDGNLLARVGGAHGEAGRDYTPRKSDPKAVNGSDESDLED